MEEEVYLNASQRAIISARMANPPEAAHKNHLQDASIEAPISQAKAARRLSNGQIDGEIVHYFIPSSRRPQFFPEEPDPSCAGGCELRSKVFARAKPSDLPPARRIANYDISPLARAYCDGCGSPFDNSCNRRNSAPQSGCPKRRADPQLRALFLPAFRDPHRK
jgi:hypothetical protein